MDGSLEYNRDKGFGNKEDANKFKQDLLEAGTLLTPMRSKCDESQGDAPEDILADGGFGGRAVDGKYEEDLVGACKLLKTLQCKCEEIRKEIERDAMKYGEMCR